MTKDTVFSVFPVFMSSYRYIKLYLTIGIEKRQCLSKLDQKYKPGKYRKRSFEEPKVRSFGLNFR